MSFKAKDWRVLCIDYRKAVSESLENTKKDKCQKKNISRHIILKLHKIKDKGKKKKKKLKEARG